MKICQVVTGIISIPNNRWGAVEKVIWNYTKHLLNNGHQVDIRYLNEVNPDDYDIVHIHMANLCIEAKKRGIKYVFSIHDHHVEHFGKGSFIYNQNLEAMKGSLFSITHAPYYVQLFNETDKLFYLPHGVDTDYFKSKEKKDYSNPKILMVANNGLAGDYAYDRKGFALGIDFAKRQDLPITIIGAEANKRFFELRPELLEYGGLTIISDNPVDDVILDNYCSHTHFLHPSCLEAGHPNLTLLEAAACRLRIVATYKGIERIPRLAVIDDLSYEGILKAFNSVNEINFERYYLYDSISWSKRVKSLKLMYESILDVNNDFDNELVEKRLNEIYTNGI